MLISKSASRITKFTGGPSVASCLHEKQTSRIQFLIVLSLVSRKCPRFKKGSRKLIKNVSQRYIRLHPRSSTLGRYN